MSKHQSEPEQAGEPQARVVVHTILDDRVCHTGTQNSQVDVIIHPVGQAPSDGFPLEVVRLIDPERRAHKVAAFENADDLIIPT